MLTFEEKQLNANNQYKKQKSLQYDVDNQFLKSFIEFVENKKKIMYILTYN